MIKSNGNKAVVAVIVVIAVISGVYLFMGNHEKKNVIVSESTAEVQEESPVDLEEKRLQEYVGKSVESILPEAWKVLDVRKKILYTLLMLFVYRLGVYVSIPGISLDVVSAISCPVHSNDFPSIFQTLAPIRFVS